MSSTKTPSENENGQKFLWKLLGGNLSSQQLQRFIIYGIFISIAYQGVPATFDLVKSFVVGQAQSQPQPQEIAKITDEHNEIRAEIAEIKQLLKEIHEVVYRMAENQSALSDDVKRVKRDAENMKKKIDALK